MKGDKSPHEGMQGETSAENTGTGQPQETRETSVESAAMRRALAHVSCEGGQAGGDKCSTEERQRETSRENHGFDRPYRSQMKGDKRRQASTGMDHPHTRPNCMETTQT